MTMATSGRFSNKVRNTFPRLFEVSSFPDLRFMAQDRGGSYLLPEAAFMAC